jgi:hypothetical protein
VAVWVAVPSVAVKVTELDAVTCRVLTANVADIVFAGMVTDTGIVAADELEFARLTTRPDGPDLPFSLTVPVTTVAEPPRTDVGDSEMLLRLAGTTVSGAVLDTEPSVAVIVALKVTLTPDVGIENCRVFAPDGTVTVAGGSTTD